MKRPDDGILLVDKEAGETSHDVVRKVKTALRCGRRYKIGHAGTLDPFATGLLVVLLGQGTKLSRFIMAGEKEYLATLELGIETDTLDPTGTVTAVRDVPRLSEAHIRDTAKRYEGTIRQTPPVYSAVKHQGARAYKLARKGIAVSLKEREVTVHALSIVSVALPEITMRIRCAGGTYIRSLAADLARDLGPGGRLKTLRRLRSGAFDVACAIQSENILTEANLREMGIPLTKALPGMDEIAVDEALAEKVRQGYQPGWNELIAADDSMHPLKENYVKLVSGQKLLAIIKKSDGGDGHEKVKFERVFS
ncbi:tRNA pseudouridine synthase B [delta proteobacterium NaphS2]|nr:tRNA pseudouridine synthase B [delta proteobacterium NaphS2]